MPPKPKKPPAPPLIVPVDLSTDDRAVLSRTVTKLRDGLELYAARFYNEQKHMEDRFLRRQSSTASHSELTEAQCRAAEARERQADASAAESATRILKDLTVLIGPMIALRVDPDADDGQTSNAQRDQALLEAADADDAESLVIEGR